jgi:hypothetical protein
MRQSMPNARPREMLDALSITGAQSRQLARYLTTRSNCFSLWITTRSKECCWRELHVRLPRPLGSSQEADDAGQAPGSSAGTAAATTMSTPDVVPEEFQREDEGRRVISFVW